MRLATCLLVALAPSLALAAPVVPAPELGLVVDGTGLAFVFDTDPAGQLGSVRVNPYGPNTPDCVFSPDGRHAFVTGTENALWVVDPRSTPPQIAPGPNPIPLSTPAWNMEPTADGRFIVVCGGGRLSVVDTASRLEHESFALGAGCVAADVCADGSVLVSTFFPEGLRRLTIDASGHLADTGESILLPFAGAIVCAPDSGSGVVTAYGGSIRSFRLPGFVFVSQTTIPAYGSSALMAHDGSHYYLRSGDGMLTAFDYDPATAELGLAPTFSFDVGFTDGLYGNDRMALDSSGQTLYVTAPHQLYVLDAVTGAVQAPIALPDLQTDGGICIGPQAAGCPVAACDDGNPCTDDGCNAAGCVHVADDSNLCGDDEACDVAHVCLSGACVASAPVDCNAPCPPGFSDLTGNGLCEKTYDIDASMLDGLDESCDGTGANRYGCSGYNYGFHWLDESAGVGPVESFVVSFVSGRRCEEGYGRLFFNGLDINFVTSPVDCSCNPVHVPLGNSFGPAAYEKNGVNLIFITPSGGCEGLSASPLLDGWFARVTVRYFPRDPACGSSSCNPTTHRCEFPTENCDDGDPCTTDACDGAGGCTHVPKAEYDPCGDGNMCNGNEYCHEDGTCYADYPPFYCSDPYPCTLDGCDPWNGCVSIFLPPGASCSDGNPCNGRETCDEQLQCNAGTPPDCDDHNPCTRDSCAPYVGCTHDPEPAYTSCDNGNPCDGHDTCDGFGICISSGSPCYPDGNPCTLEFCDPVYGCGEQPAPAGYSCNDGNACNGDEVCNGTGTCLPAPPLHCDDGNVCTTDSCDPVAGCVHSDNSAPCDDGNACTRADFCGGGHCAGSDPVVCGALDQCHTSGACDPASGLCANPVKPDGTVCSDNDLCTTGETCRTGVCTPAFSGLTEPNPRTNGYYKRLCHGPHSGDALTDADAACVASVASTFGGISTVADICAELTPSQPNNDPCDRSDDDLMVLALNICRARVCTAQSIDSQCGGNVDVGTALSESNAIQADPSRNAAACDHAKCLDEEINTGRALEMNSLLLRRESGAIRLDWNPPYLDDGTGLPSQYHVWRRPQGSLAPFVQIGATVEASFLDATAGVGAFQYEVTAVMH